MSQQINLLVKERLLYSSLRLALSGWGVLILLLLAFWMVNQVRLSAASENEAVAAKQLADARTIIKQNEDRQAALLAEIEAAKPHAEASRKVLEMANQLGVTGGYSRHFMRIANVTQDGLWLVKVGISEAGRAITVEGQSMSNELVVDFTSGMNAAFAGDGLKFSVLEMSPVTSNPGASVAMRPTVTAMRFVVR